MRTTVTDPMSDSMSELATLPEKGPPPETRLGKADAALNIVSNMRAADERRSTARALLRGLLDGNPPFKSSKLRKIGQSDRANINFRTAEAFFEHALSAYYDIFAEAETYARVTYDVDDVDRMALLNRVVTQAFDRANKADEDLDDVIQTSQSEMVYFGNGPVAWTDPNDWRPESFECNQLLIPSNAPTKLSDWDHMALLVEWSPAKLYSFIRNGESSHWNKSATRKAIIESAPPGTNKSGSEQSWEWWQNQIRNNEVYWDSAGKTIEVAFLFWREFPTKEDPIGKISYCIIGLNTKETEFLYRHERCYEKWQNCINPFYLDKRNRQHHGTKGLGVKMFGALDLENRVMCGLADAAFNRMTVMLKPTTPEGVQKMSAIRVGPWTVVPSGLDVVQANIQGVLDAPLAVKSELTRTVYSNLSQYRQGLQQKEGNPITAKEASIQIQQQSVLQKTQLNRYYTQLDSFWEERFRRLVAIAKRVSTEKAAETVTGGRAAWDFRQFITARGITISEVEKFVAVRSVRVVGQGSAMQRQQTMQMMIGMAPMLPEKGRVNLLDDFIGSSAGMDMIERWNPKEGNTPDNDHWEAMVENGVMRNNAPVVRISGQNDVIHAMIHLQAMAQAMESVQQGGNPLEVLEFMDVAGAHTAQHLAQFEGDPSRKQIAQTIRQRLTQLGGMADKLKGEVAAKMQKQQQDAQAQAQAAQAATSKEAIESAKAKAEIERKQALTNAEIERKGRKAQADIAAKLKKTQTDVATKDARTATDIRLAHAAAIAEAAKTNPPAAQ